MCSCKYFIYNCLDNKIDLKMLVMHFVESNIDFRICLFNKRIYFKDLKSINDKRIGKM